jgi:hypothetical protein
VHLMECLKIRCHGRAAHFEKAHFESYFTLKLKEPVL